MDNVKMKASEITDMLEYMYENNCKNQEEINTKPTAINITGDAGLGKSSLVKQFAESHNLEFVKINLSMIDETAELLGFPIKQHLMCKKCNQNKDLFTPTEESTELWVNESATSIYTSQGYVFTGETRMSYAPPQFIAGKGEGGILCLDDSARCDLRLKQACMEIILDQKYHSWELPKKWMVILTNNPDDGNYLVNEEDDAMKSRYISFYMRFDINDWMKWAEEVGIKGTCINFLALNPDIIGKDKKINPRSISMFFNSIRNLDLNNEKNLARMQLLAQASVGPEVANLFTQFVHNKLDRIITPKEVFELDEKEMYDKFVESTGKDDNYRPDIASVIIRRCVNYMREYVKTNKVTKNIIERICYIIKSNLITKDIKHMFAVDLYKIDTSKFRPLTEDIEVSEEIIDM